MILRLSKDNYNSQRQYLAPRNARCEIEDRFETLYLVCVYLSSEYQQIHQTRNLNFVNVLVPRVVCNWIRHFVVHPKVTCKHDEGRFAVNAEPRAMSECSGFMTAHDALKSATGPLIVRLLHLAVTDPLWLRTLASYRATHAFGELNSQASLCSLQ